MVFGCASTSLTSPERSLFRECKPFGLILFKRNCVDPEQVGWLVKEFRQAVGRDDAPVMIDQEGGRVARLQPPQWPQHPPAAVFGEIYQRDPEWGAQAMQLYARIVANELYRLGINVNLAPVIDLAVEGATNAIGDRAISSRPSIVAALARIWCETFLENGIFPVIKHLPGHGRMRTDPHHDLPVIEASRAELETEDFVPFELLKDLPIGMNSHAIFTQLDPHNPVSLSAIVHQDIIRGMLGFDGLLLSDDISMKALEGAPEDLAQRAHEAGADVVLHCNGNLTEMEAIAKAMGPMTTEGWTRWTYAQSMLRVPVDSYDPREDNQTLDTLLGGIAYG
jgi:beta-N-acetylhexosaminidase